MIAVLLKNGNTIKFPGGKKAVVERKQEHIMEYVEVSRTLDIKDADDYNGKTIAQVQMDEVVAWEFQPEDEQTEGEE